MKDEQTFKLSNSIYIGPASLISSGSSSRPSGDGTGSRVGFAEPDSLSVSSRSLNVSSLVASDFRLSNCSLLSFCSALTCLLFGSPMQGPPKQTSEALRLPPQ